MRYKRVWLQGYTALDMPRSFCLRDRYRKCTDTWTIQSCERELFGRLLCQFFFAASSKRVSNLHQCTGSSNNCWTVVATKTLAPRERIPKNYEHKFYSNEQWTENDAHLFIVLCIFRALIKLPACLFEIIEKENRLLNYHNYFARRRVKYL